MHQVAQCMIYPTAVHYMIGWERVYVADYCGFSANNLYFCFISYFLAQIEGDNYLPRGRLSFICNKGRSWGRRGEGMTVWQGYKWCSLPFFFDAISFFSFNLSCPPRPWQGYKWCSLLLCLLLSGCNLFKVQIMKLWSFLLFYSFLSYTKLKMTITTTFIFFSISLEFSQFPLSFLNFSWAFSSSLDFTRFCLTFLNFPCILSTSLDFSQFSLTFLNFPWLFSISLEF